MSSPFADLGVPRDVVAVLDRAGITEPFPIQTATIPDAMAGRDIAGRAPTGSGKTLAFAIPMVVNVAPSRPRRPSGLVLVPTRELAEQVRKELAPLASEVGRRVTTIYGGVAYGPQRSALNRGADIVVACPGRLEDLIEQGAVDLSGVHVAVIDEADRMADMGFLPAVQRILELTDRNRQTLLFSATLDGVVDVLVRRYQRDPRRHEVADEGELGVVRHLFWKTEHTGRVGLTAEVVSRHDSAIVFCRTKHGADRLARQLVQSGVPAVAIHGNRTQPQRHRALAQFASGSARALVATDVAARGIHVDAVGCVIHFDPPNDERDYVHRSGRTGRAGVDGTVVSLLMHDQVRSAQRMQRTLGMPQGVDRADLGTLGAPRITTVARPEYDAPAPRPDRGERRDSGSRPRQGRPNGNRRQAPRSSTGTTERAEADQWFSSDGGSDGRRKGAGARNGRRRSGQGRTASGYGQRRTTAGEPRRSASSDRGFAGTGGGQGRPDEQSGRRDRPRHQGSGQPGRSRRGGQPGGNTRRRRYP